MTCFESSQGSQISPLWLAQTRLKRGRFDECCELCDTLLRKNRHDMVHLKHLFPYPFLLGSMVPQTSSNDAEKLDRRSRRGSKNEVQRHPICVLQTEGDALLDGNKATRNARVGTSFARPLTSTQVRFSCTIRCVGMNLEVCGN